MATTPTAFTATTGFLAWSPDRGVSSPNVSYYQGAGDAVILDGASRPVFTLRNNTDTSWPAHTVNGIPTTDIGSFYELLKAYGAVSSSDVDETRLPYYHFMDTVGDGSGDINMGVDGSTTNVIFRSAPSVNQKAYITRIIPSIRDAGTFDAGGWGNQAVPLINGLKLIWKRGAVEYDLTSNPIRSHYDLASTSFDISENSWGQGDAFLVNRFTFTKGGNHIILDGRLGDELQVVVRDDLTYLVEQRISAQGFYRIV